MKFGRPTKRGVKYNQPGVVLQPGKMPSKSIKVKHYQNYLESHKQDPESQKQKLIEAIEQAE